MGSDNIEMLSKWERAKDIIKNYTIYVYPRKKITKKIVNKNIIY